MNQAATQLSQYLDRDAQTIEAFDAELWSAMHAETVRQDCLLYTSDAADE